MSCLLQIFLVFCIIGVCSATAVSTKTKAASTVAPVVAKKSAPINNEKDNNKEKRESAVSSGPYSYDPPQKSFQIPIHASLKPQTSIEYKPVKVQEYEYHHQKPAHIEVVQIPKKVEHYQEAKQVASQDHDDHYSHQVQYSYPAALQSYLESLSMKNYHQETPTVVYYRPSSEPSHSQQYHTPSYYYKYPSSSSNYKAPATSSYSYTYQPLHTSQVPSFSYVSEQEHHHQPQEPQQQQQEVYHGYSEIPSQQEQQQLFYPSYTSEFSSKPVKVPDYAIGHKGLGHYASISSFAPEIEASLASYLKPQSHEQAFQYYSTQTERPYKPSVYVSTPIRGYDSHSEQSITHSKPTIQYLPPKKTYLPAKEEISVPSKNYLPVKEQVVEFVTQPSKKYLPSKQEYLPPTSNYHVPKVQPQVEYQIQYITVPEKSYLPAASNSYIPPKKVQEPPKNSYIPPIVVASTTAKPAHSTQAPKHTYLPPNNPYQSNYHASSQGSQMSPSLYEQYHENQYGNNNNNDYQQQYQRYSSSSHQ